MGTQTMKRLKKSLAMSLVVILLVTVTAITVSAQNGEFGSTNAYIGPHYNKAHHGCFDAVKSRAYDNGYHTGYNAGYQGLWNIGGAQRPSGTSSYTYPCYSTGYRDGYIDGHYDFTHPPVIK